MRSIVSPADLEALLAAPLAVLYKHSPICPASDMAYEEIRTFVSRRDVPVYMVDVIHHRPLSRTLAERTGVQHAPPLAIVLGEGVVAWHRAHYEIQSEAIERVVDHLAGAGDGALD